MNTDTISTKKEYSERFKKNIVAMFLRERNGNLLRNKYRIPKSTFYHWVDEYKKIYSEDGYIITKHDYKKLKWENARMQKQLEAYRITGCLQQSTDKDKLVAIDKYRSLYPIDMKFYICSIEDIYSRYVISYTISTINDSALIANTFVDAYTKRNPPYGLIFHSDNGASFTATAIRTLLKSYGITQSLSRIATPQDNSHIESFFATLKKEELHRKTYHSPEDFFQ